MIPLKINKAYSADERMTQALVSLDIANRVHILIFRKLYDQECNQIVYQIIQFVQDRQCLIYLEEQNIKQIQELDEEFKKLQSGKLKIFEQKIHETKIDLIITIGGDGTILYQQIQTIKSRISPPIIAFEKGTLGFLCIFPVNLHQEILSGVLDNIARKDNIVVEAKIRLQGTLNQENGQLHEYHVLNEFVVSRGMNPHCLKMEIYINDLLLTVSIGDGLIIATPTGSTAYSLSAGGSIIQNEVGSIQISPICPLSLSFRPVVLPSCMKIKLKLAKDCRGGGVITADGQKNYDFNQGDEFNIQLSPHSVQMSCLTKDSTYSDWVAKLRQMLNWNQQFKEHRIIE